MIIFIIHPKYPSQLSILADELAKNPENTIYYFCIENTSRQYPSWNTGNTGFGGIEISNKNTPPVYKIIGGEDKFQRNVDINSKKMLKYLIPMNAAQIIPHVVISFVGYGMNTYTKCVVGSTPTHTTHIFGYFYEYGELTGDLSTLVATTQHLHDVDTDLAQYAMMFVLNTAHRNRFPVEISSRLLSLEQNILNLIEYIRRI